ncbi:hypothetical protein EXE59_18995 [Nocardioides eburneiflavus]|uniref:Uncharacterized protein n=1 Tax=Nocardioides eburneiflavus TaxID=2518372 RepID=A0A4Z1CHV3_9ACTN|nr:hypothetical protein [Nocardioides eburneiflavus]TGN65808.1 hypothetical protein EXE59_18995 [Nocardioides eburneiflavus]
MNTCTTLDASAFDSEEDTVPQLTGANIRVAIREIREYSYRALVAAGASPGEAATGASQVLHAELHAGVGLTGLVADLARGAWPREGLSCARRAGARTILQVDCAGRSGGLRVGPYVIDLAAGETEPAVVTTSAEVAVDSMLNDPLLAAARMTGTSVTAIQLLPHEPSLVTMATPEGNLAHGELDPAAIVSLLDTDDLVGLEGFVVATGVRTTETSLARLTWDTPGQRAERRLAAARHGVDVDRATWRVVASHAQHFLVPEADS